MVDADQQFSPFDAPMREPNKPKPVETSGGIPLEKITDAELDGKRDIPKDAPTFEIPKFDEVPNMPGGMPAGDPFAPGSGNSGMGGGKGTGSGSGNQAGDGTKVDSGFAKEFSEYTAKW